MITPTAQTIRDAWICSWCKAECNADRVLRMLTDKQFEQASKDSQTSHGICDGCKDKQMIELANFKRGRLEK